MTTTCALPRDRAEEPFVQGVDSAAHGFGCTAETEAHEAMSVGGVEVDTGGRRNAELAQPLSGERFAVGCEVIGCLLYTSPSPRDRG